MGLFSRRFPEHRDGQESESLKQTGKRQVPWISIFNTANNISVIIFREKNAFLECFLPPLSIPSVISLQMFPGAWAQRQEERSWAPTPQTSPGRRKSWDRKASSKQVPVVLCGDREGNQAVEDVARSQQKLHVTTEPPSCLSMSCSTSGAIKGGIRVSVMEGKAQWHCQLQRPWSEQSIPRPSCRAGAGLLQWLHHWSLSHPAPPL